MIRSSTCLNGRVTELEKFSRLKFRTVQGQEDVGRKVSNQELRDLASTYVKLRNSNQFLEDLYSEHLNANPGRIWTLVMGQPNLEKALRIFNDDGAFGVEFILERLALESSWIRLHLEARISTTKRADDLRISRRIQPWTQCLE
jgi:hypothetical protein